MSEQSLKRYNLVAGLLRPYEVGLLVYYSDIHALIDTLHAIESARGHDVNCASSKQMANFYGKAPGECDCPHGRMMAVLEAAKGDKS